MKRKGWLSSFIILIVILLGVLLIAENNKVKFDTVDNISMIIKEGTLTNEDATVIITDTTEENRKNVYMPLCMIYKKSFGRWKNLSDKPEWVNAIAYHVDKNNKLELECKFLTTKLDKGSYRLAKIVTLAKDGTPKKIM